MALGVLALGAVAVPFAMARGSAAQPGPGVVTNLAVEGRDYAFDAPDTVPAGLVAISFTNTGQEPHHAQLLRLKDGISLETFFAQLQGGPEAALALVTTEGGAGVIAPGQRAEVLVDLDPGTYVWICFVSSPDGAPHVAKGMIKPFQVTGRTAEVRLRDFTFDMPATFSAGPVSVKVINDGPQPHEWAVVKLQPGKTLDDVLSYEQNPSGPPPYDPAAGFQAIDAGGMGWVHMTFTPGNYIALCFVPDPASGKAHIELGMIMPFTVE
jgi:FtsP/CotA-like multicopper oxidase with cupredoxin domain